MSEWVGRGIEWSGGLRARRVGVRIRIRIRVRVRVHICVRVNGIKRGELEDTDDYGKRRRY